MKYADMAVPSRALHLWRYTPWTRIHPSKVEEVPNASPVSFTVGTGGELIEGAPRIIDAEDIGRVFLSELASQAYTVETSGEQNILRVEGSGTGLVAPLTHLFSSSSRWMASCARISATKPSFSRLEKPSCIKPSTRSAMAVSSSRPRLMR